LSLLFIFSGCFPQPHVVKVENPKLRIKQQGYSLIPTNETGWIIPARSSYQLALARKDNTESDETFAIQATLFNLPHFSNDQELLEIVKQGQKADTNPLRFTFIKNETINYMYQNISCVKSHASVIDKKAEKKSNSIGNMILEAKTLVCPHPENKRVGVSITYSQRYYKSQQTPGFMDKSDSVINSVKFEELNI